VAIFASGKIGVDSPEKNKRKFWVYDYVAKNRIMGKWRIKEALHGTLLLS